MSSNFIPKGYIVVMWCSGTNFIVKKIPMFYVLTLFPNGYVVVMWYSQTNFIVKKIPMFYVNGFSVQ